MITFCKYHGAGNDFILIDNREKVFTPTPEKIKFLCHRRFGIGADGLMLLEEDKNSNFYMHFYNSDGYEGPMCGNGGRCIVAFAHKLGIVRDIAMFNSSDGIHHAAVKGSGVTLTVNLKLKDVKDVNIGSGYYFLNTGSPHYVQFVENLETFDVVSEGRRIRHSKLFAPHGTNVNFAEIRGDEILIGTFERGVEDETLACGTGATATAIAASIHTNSNKTAYKIRAKGGNLKVNFEKMGVGKYRNIWLEGPATLVFEGKIE
ncbi:MAG: diaminopimelate epimerase [Prevotellaceae bacterium]|jgi:diaminopimelate epimerase|nr:diaminopimelate epimerase [Prevotellaceae bacterium]